MSFLELFNNPREPNLTSSICVCMCSGARCGGGGAKIYSELKETFR